MNFAKWMDELAGNRQSEREMNAQDVSDVFLGGAYEGGYTPSQFLAHSAASGQDENMLIFGGVR